MGTCEEPVKLCKTGLCITSSSQSSVELTLGSHAVFFGHCHQYVLEQSVHQSFASCLHQILDSPHPLFEMCLVSNTFRRFALIFKRSFLQFRANLYTFAMGFYSCWTLQAIFAGSRSHERATPHRTHILFWSEMSKGLSTEFPQFLPVLVAIVVLFSHFSCFICVYIYIYN